MECPPHSHYNSCMKYEDRRCVPAQQKFDYCVEGLLISSSLHLHLDIRSTAVCKLFKVVSVMKATFCPNPTSVSNHMNVE